MFTVVLAQWNHWRLAYKKDFQQLSATEMPQVKEHDHVFKYWENPTNVSPSEEVFPVAIQTQKTVWLSF